MEADCTAPIQLEVPRSGRRRGDHEQAIAAQNSGTTPAGHPITSSPAAAPTATPHSVLALDWPPMTSASCSLERVDMELPMMKRV